MTIDEAIEVLESSIVGIESLDDPPLPNAIKLGLEALKAYQYFRTQELQGLLPNLPGETKG